jgi:hypothetical protein
MLLKPCAEPPPELPACGRTAREGWGGFGVRWGSHRGGDSLPRRQRFFKPASARGYFRLPGFAGFGVGTATVSPSVS